MNKDDLVYVGHMVDTARKAIAALSGIGRGEFDQNEILRLAMAHLVQVIGEAARKVSSAFQTSHPAIPSRAIVGMRHRFVHDYLNIDTEILWETVRNDLPSLVGQLESLLPPDDVSLTSGKTP